MQRGARKTKCSKCSQDAVEKCPWHSELWFCKEHYRQHMDSEHGKPVGVM
jgi:hypothetical protein